MNSVIRRKKISVVVPTYNRAHLISETIESIINQSYHPSEIIIIDDGSTDDTHHVVSKYFGIVRYKRIPNSGVGVARNVGVEIAENDWIAFCDSDDLWHRDKLYYQVELLNYKIKCEYCFTDFVTVEESSWSRKSKFEDSPSGFWDIPHIKVNADTFIITEPLYSKLLTFNPIFPSTVIMNKSFFYRIGRFNEIFSKKISEDFEFSLRCVHECPIGIIRHQLVGIRKHQENFSKGKISGISFIVGDIEILKYSLDNHALGKKHESLIKEEIIQRSISVAHGAFALGELNIYRYAMKCIPVRYRSAKLWIKEGIVLFAHLFLQKYIKKHLANKVFVASDE